MQCVFHGWELESCEELWAVCRGGVYGVSLDLLVWATDGRGCGEWSVLVDQLRETGEGTAGAGAGSGGEALRDGGEGMDFCG
jgi:hypothetical protein